MFLGAPSPRREGATPQGSGGASNADNRFVQSGIAPRDIARRSERQGRCIRHAPLRAALSVFPLTVAMIESTLGAVLMATVGTAPLFAKGWKATPQIAITLTAITGATDAENRVASTAHSLPKNNLVLIRHPGRQVGLDKDDSSWQGRTIRCLNLMATSYKVAKLGSRRWCGGIPGRFPPFKTTYNTSQLLEMIDLETCAYRRR